MRQSPPMKKPRVETTLLFLALILFAGVRASGCRRKPAVTPETRTTTPGPGMGYTPVIFPATPTPKPGEPLPLPG